METKIITTSFDDRADVHWPTATLQCELESIEDAFRDCNSELSGAEMPPLTYSFQADAISEMTENMMKLQVYAGTVRNQIYLELDNPLYQHFKDNATETLSQIILDEITTDNTIGMEEYYEVAGKGKVYGRTRVKKNLTMRDFLGLQEITPESGMPVLENVETIGEFASMFRKDYDIMTSMYVDVNACIEAYMTSGEFNHHAYHPIGDMLSGVLDITVIKPIIECFTGTDLITGERLTETEKAWKAVGAAIDAITFGQGTTALKGVKLFSTEAFETIGRTFMWDLVSESAAYGINYAGQQIGMPEGFNWILTAATGMTVSMAGDKFILEGVDGTKIKKSFKEMKEWLVEKLKKSESGKYSAGDATFMDADDAFVSNISRRTDVDANGYFDVIAHGTPNGIQITHNGQQMIVNHRTAARLIQNSDGYNGQSIRLLSCNTGALDNGFAQNLANKLNVEVYAPTNYLWSTPNGNYFVAGMNTLRLPDMNNRGKFKLFSPGGN